MQYFIHELDYIEGLYNNYNSIFSNYVIATFVNYVNKIV